jgi:hypothetical protein
MDAPRVKIRIGRSHLAPARRKTCAPYSSRCGWGRLLRNNSISENFGHDGKNDFTRLSFPKVLIGNPFCRSRKIPSVKGWTAQQDGVIVVVVAVAVLIFRLQRLPFASTCTVKYKISDTA